MQKILIGAVIMILIGGVAFSLYQAQNTSKITNTSPEVLGEPRVTIVRTDEGYEPKEVTIKKGDIVLFTNESSEYHWPASDLHPTHGIYPEFDPLMPIASGEEWKFKFEQGGVWKYHDHIRANKVGSITVVE